jgi:hypothetical protein
LGQTGSVALEWCLLAPALFALMLGGIDMARYLFTAQSVRELTGIVSRAAMVDETLAGCTAARGLAARTSLLDNPARLTVCITRGAADLVMPPAAIEVAYAFQFSLNLLSGRVTEIRETTLLNW